MHILKAYWEKRNLGVSCTEINADLDDTVDDVRAAIRLLSDDYVVAKVPVPRTDLLFFFQEAGYAVIEVTLRLRMRLRELVYPPLYKRYEKHLTFREAKEEDVCRIMLEIQAGVFATDRVSLDPRFTPDQAAIRYRNWVEEELHRSSKVYITMFKSDEIGFSLLRNDGGGRFCGLFGALYSEKNKTALGFAVGLGNMIKAKELGGTTIETTVSTNNLAALKMNLSIGYEVSDIFYVLVKHVESTHISMAGD